MQHCRIFALSQDVANQHLSIGAIYRNWKMASANFRKHEESKVHRMPKSQHVEAKGMQEMGESISQQLSRAYSSDVQLEMLNVY